MYQVWSKSIEGCSY